jgi:flagellar biosynthesis protein FlhG
MKTIAVTGGKGGVGKTLVSINLAISLAQRGLRVVLFDADLQLANLDIALDIAPKMNLQHVVAGQATLREILTPGPGGIRVATGGSAVQGLMNAGPKRMATFLSQLEDLASDTDVLIFDTGAGLDNRVMTFLRLAEEIVLVTTPDPTSVTDAYATAKVLWKKDPSAQVGVLANMVQSNEEAQRVYVTLQGICAQFLDQRPRFVGSIRADLKALDSIRKRSPLVLMAPESPAAEDFLRLAATLSASVRMAA